MPNHVTNRLTITGDEKSLSELFNACFRKQKREVPDFWHEKANDVEADEKVVKSGLSASLISKLKSRLMCSTSTELFQRLHSFLLATL